MDGYPRNLNQTEFLDKLLKVGHVIFLDIDKDETIKRLSARRQCRDCNKVYGYLDMEKIKGNKCECGGDLYQREDDKPAAIKKRLETYHKETKPLTDFYDKKGILNKINGEQPIEKVFGDITKSLK